ncbi:hypothetical protein ACWGI8_43510, partial [Streptomyces sp. NPDC054841]
QLDVGNDGTLGTNNARGTFRSVSQQELTTAVAAAMPKPRNGEQPAQPEVYLLVAAPDDLTAYRWLADAADRLGRDLPAVVHAPRPGLTTTAQKIGDGHLPVVLRRGQAVAEWNHFGALPPGALFATAPDGTTAVFRIPAAWPKSVPDAPDGLSRRMAALGRVKPAVLESAVAQSVPPGVFRVFVNVAEGRPLAEVITSNGSTTEVTASPSAFRNWLRTSTDWDGASAVQIVPTEGSWANGELKKWSDETSPLLSTSVAYPKANGLLREDSGTRDIRHAIMIDSDMTGTAWGVSTPLGTDNGPVLGSHPSGLLWTFGTEYWFRYERGVSTRRLEELPDAHGWLLRHHHLRLARTEMVSVEIDPRADAGRIWRVYRLPERTLRRLTTVEFAEWLAGTGITTRAKEAVLLIEGRTAAYERQLDRELSVLAQKSTLILHTAPFDALVRWAALPGAPALVRTRISAIGAPALTWRTVLPDPGAKSMLATGEDGILWYPDSMLVTIEDRLVAGYVDFVDASHTLLQQFATTARNRGVLALRSRYGVLGVDQSNGGYRALDTTLSSMLMAWLKLPKGHSLDFVIDAPEDPELYAAMKETVLQLATQVHRRAFIPDRGQTASLKFGQVGDAYWDLQSEEEIQATGLELYSEAADGPGGWTQLGEDPDATTMAWIDRGFLRHVTPNPVVTRNA